MCGQRLRVFACERCRKLDGALRREGELGAGRSFCFELCLGLCLGLCVRPLQVRGPLALAVELGRELVTHCRPLRNFEREPRRNLGFALGGPAFRLQFTLRLCDVRSRICGRAFETGGRRALAGEVRSERFTNGAKLHLTFLLKTRHSLLRLLDRSAEL